MQEPRTNFRASFFVDEQEVGYVEAIDPKGLEEQMYKLEEQYNKYLNGEYDDKSVPCEEEQKCSKKKTK
jgi:hypothetical protein